MKVKSMIAALAASAIALGAMAIPASAEALATKVGNDEGAVAYELPLDGYDLSKVDKIVAEVTFDTGSGNGCIGYTATGDKWTAVNCEAGGTQNESWTGTWEATDLEGTVEGGIQVQLWWVNPFYDEDGQAGDAGTATVNSLTLYDADGNELEPSDDDTTTTAADDDDTTGTTTSTTKKASGSASGSSGSASAAKTGDAGVGVAVAALSLAGVAAYVSRKKN